MLYIITVMRCKVIELYKCGERLARDLVLGSEPISGDLVIEDNHVNASGRALRMADLLHITISTRRPLLPPLFDPNIIRMKPGEGGFLLRGWQIEAKTCDGQSIVREHAQCWWVRL